jgi:sec-independent protein translocase protein TatC
LPILLSSTLLFYCGMAFAYFVIMPLFFAFITGTAPEGVAVMTDINRYLDFVMTIFFAFGVAFEVPVATVILALAGILTPEAMASKRPYIIVGAFIVGMLLTPPDVISQTLLAVPMWFLFEIGVFVSRLLLRRRQEAQAAEAVETGKQ